MTQDLNNRKGPWLQTHSGRAFFIEDIRPEDISINDIAHHLSQICRFSGACEKFYSVAEHSVRALELIKYDNICDELCKFSVMKGKWSIGFNKDWITNITIMPYFTNNFYRNILMHDSAEAYVNDLVRPVKKILSKFSKIENNIFDAIAKKFDLIIGKMNIPTGLPATSMNYNITEAVQFLDNIMLMWEARDIMKPHPLPWVLDGKYDHLLPKKTIIHYTPQEAERLFLDKCEELGLLNY